MIFGVGFLFCVSVSVCCWFHLVGLERFGLLLLREFDESFVASVESTPRLVFVFIFQLDSFVAIQISFIPDHIHHEL